MGGSNHTSVQAHSKEGDQFNLQHTITDSPILPAENLRQLQAIDPSLVKWVVEQTEKESDHRRREDSKINFFIFFERLSSVLAGVVVALFGLSLGGYLIMNGHDWAGVGLCGTGLASIISVLVARHNANKPNTRTNDSKPAPRRPRKPAGKS
jgi:hypothetical protein